MWQIERLQAPHGQTINLFAKEASEADAPLKLDTPHVTEEILLQMIYESFALSSLQIAGAVFAYPDALEKFQWICLEGLTSGKNKAEAEDTERRKTKK